MRSLVICITWFTKMKNVSASKKKKSHTSTWRKESNSKLGDQIVYPDQNSSLHLTFKTGLFYHHNCYKKCTKAISVLKRKTDNESITATSTLGSTSVKTTGEFGKTSFPKYFMLCKSKNPITVQRKKYFPKDRQKLNVDVVVRAAAKLHQDKETNIDQRVFSQNFWCQ